MIPICYSLNFIFVLNSCLPFCATSHWNFSDVNLPNDVPIWRFAVWKNRAFLAVPRWQKRMESTLLEVPWPEIWSTLQIGSNLRVLPFPNYDSQLVNGDCQHLHSVTGLDVDSRGRLWILDAPDDIGCQGKIVIYDLKRNDQEVLVNFISQFVRSSENLTFQILVSADESKVTRSELVGVSTKSLRCITVDPVVGIWGYRAYIGDPGNESIIVYSLGQRRWWRLKLLHGPEVPHVYSNDLAISRRNSMLYLTGCSSHDLFSVNLDNFRNDEGPPAILGYKASQNTSVSWLGSKMGSSTGLICDVKGGLHYFMITELASVRWDTKLNLKAESHSVLLQEEDVPCITDYIMDSQKNIWGLVNSECPFGRKTTVGGKKRVSKEFTLKYRTWKIYKYNPFSF